MCIRDSHINAYLQNHFRIVLKLIVNIYKYKCNVCTPQWRSFTQFQTLFLTPDVLRVSAIKNKLMYLSSVAILRKEIHTAVNKCTHLEGIVRCNLPQ